MPWQSKSQLRMMMLRSHPSIYSSTIEESKQSPISTATVCFGVRKDLFFLFTNGPSDQGALGDLPVVFAGGLAGDGGFIGNL